MRYALPALLLLLVAPAIGAQQAPATPASFLVYRPWPDPLHDELASALAPPPFDAPRLPATRIDRALVASPAPENAPESAPAHYREMVRVVQQAEAEGTRVGAVLVGAVEPGALAMRLELRALSPGAPSRVEAAFVVFEHGVDVAGRAEPYVARFAAASTNATVPGNLSMEIRVDPAWSVDRLGVVAVLRAEERVVQSATWLPRQDAPTQQLSKAPLVEHVTASWCEPCRPSDEAFLLLATQRGAAGPLEAGGARAGYLRAPDGWLWMGLGLGALGAVALARGGRRA